MRELKGDWRDLFNGFMVALDLRKCFLALCGIAVTIFACGGLTIYLGNHLDWQHVQVPRDLVLHKWWVAACQSWDVIYWGTADPTGEIKGGYRHDHWIALSYSIVFGVLLLGIWSYFGGAIARIAAYEIAKDGERIETRKALQFARRKFWSFFWAPLICLIGFLFFAFCCYAGGVVGKALDYLWVGSVLVAVLLPLALLSGFIMTLILVGSVTGLPLFLPAVAAEGTDSFDAVSRGFSYVYSRPWHYLGYQGISAAYGYVCIAFVILFAVTMCHLGVKMGEMGFELCGAWVRKDAQGQRLSEFRDVSNAAWGMILSERHTDSRIYRWDCASIVREPHPYGRLMVLSNQIVNADRDVRELPLNHTLAGVAVTLWLVITLGLALGYVVSYAISQQTMIYYILRKKVDGIEMNEVFEEQEEEAKPAEAAGPAGAPPPAPGGESPRPPEAPKA
jgi:hypothetical protein